MIETKELGYIPFTLNDTAETVTLLSASHRRFTLIKTDQENYILSTIGLFFYDRLFEDGDVIIEEIYPLDKELRVGFITELYSAKLNDSGYYLGHYPINPIFRDVLNNYNLLLTSSDLKIDSSIIMDKQHDKIIEDIKHYLNQKTMIKLNKEHKNLNVRNI